LNWREVTAIFGGTFDPPHLGHREAVASLFKVPGVGRVFVSPAATPPLKASRASTEARIAMTRLAFAGLPDVTIDLREIERAKKDPAKPSYSFDTLLELKREIPGKQLAFVLGTDQAARLPSWHRYPEILDLCHWIVLKRKGSPASPPFGDSRFTVCETDASAASSTAIREAIAKTGKPPENTLMPEVQSYLKLHRIYGTSGGE
jgi:nicotinate (nicotinamide) nucleotide adenylyltransferase